MEIKITASEICVCGVYLEPTLVNISTFGNPPSWIVEWGNDHKHYAGRSQLIRSSSEKRRNNYLEERQKLNTTNLSFPLYEKIECQIFWDGDKDSFQDVTLTFDENEMTAVMERAKTGEYDSEEEYFFYLSPDELASLLKGISEGYNSWNIPNQNWAIDLCEDYRFILFTK